ncbi:MAG: DUF4365 domain-containing protein, partial [Chlorobiales bacterium]|nr:DUF4365 domain-containing protein [Chlorobiales bacterium]
MTSINDLPQRNAAHDTAEAAETAFRSAIKSCDLFVVQREDRNDYGTDVQIEARRGNEMTNFRAHVQLKGTACPVNANDSVSVSVSRTSLNYLLTQTDSIYVCYHLPSKRLLARYADDVYREYEHRGAEWTRQESVTINLTQHFDDAFQHRLNSRMLSSGMFLRDRRLLWAATPPEKISLLVDIVSPIIVPPDPEHASKVLAELYQVGNDVAISSSFEQFVAVLGFSGDSIALAYMSEINLGINGFSFDQDRVKQGIQVLQSAIESGSYHTGSLLYCIGNAWLALQDYEKAQQVYRVALLQLDSPELRSVAAQCNKNFGSALEEIGDIDEAIAFYERALEIDPDLNEAHFALALCHRRQDNNLALALEHLDCVLPRRDSALQMSAVQGWRIELLFRTGAIDAAFREIASLLGEADQHNWVWPWCARLIAEFGRSSTVAVQQAVRFWKAYLREHPDHCVAHREQLLCFWLLRAAELPTEINFDEFRQAITQ